MSFFNLNNFDCLVFDGITTRFSTKEQTKWLNATLYIEKPKKNLLNLKENMYLEKEYLYSEAKSIDLFYQVTVKIVNLDYTFI